MFNESAVYVVFILAVLTVVILTLGTPDLLDAITQRVSTCG